ncbi:hypothetical protein CRM22_007864 [Opisthorchis felineus]|uniref:Uncharacterized protein n=1 Tax=Opisthorchis felineus TaxID=147828 RepID=A0A4S2LEC8_OPIFE|nr:hypothetical protein CRM22_007864 [Opisthorchis felineus]
MLPKTMYFIGNLLLSSLHRGRPIEHLLKTRLTVNLLFQTTIPESRIFSWMAEQALPELKTLVKHQRPGIFGRPTEILMFTSVLLSIDRKPLLCKRLIKYQVEGRWNYKRCISSSELL